MNFLNSFGMRMCLLDHLTMRTSREIFTEQLRRANHWSSAVALMKNPGARAYLGGSYRCTSSSVNGLCGCESARSVKDVDINERKDSKLRLRYNLIFQHRHTDFCRQENVDLDLFCVKMKMNLMTRPRSRSKCAKQDQSGMGGELVFSSTTQNLYKSRTFRPLYNLPSFATPGIIGDENVSRCAKLMIVRTFRSYSGRFANRNDNMNLNNRKNNSVKEENHDSEEEIEEWVHPDDRSDLILDKDPELKSLLCELATDFGKEKSLGSISEAESGGDNPDKPRDRVVEKTGDKTDTGAKLDGETKMTKFDVGGVEHFEPVGSENEDAQLEKKFVFSICDLVSILREENAQDICVINIPKEKQYVDYFVVVTGRSPRHLKAIALHINQQYKSRKTKEDPFVLVEGEDTDDWICMDFGNIVLHMMSEETREFYELEKLWTLGPEFDDQLRRLKEYEIKMKETVDSLDLTGTSIEKQEESGDGKPVISFAR